MTTTLDWKIIKSPADYPSQDSVFLFVGVGGKLDIGYLYNSTEVHTLCHISQWYPVDKLYGYAELKLPDEMKDYLKSLNNQSFHLSKFLSVI